jgi:hypothetical protein
MNLSLNRLTRRSRELPSLAAVSASCRRARTV